MNLGLEWLSMGGYASYVWPAYGLVCSALLMIWLVVKRQKRQMKARLEQWFKS